MQPLVSVIVPVHNGRAYLADCIESIEKQTYKELEVIIINDGSTDGTDKVCARLGEAYGNIRVIAGNDEGVSAARNAGLEAARGEYVTFVDADDRLMPEMIGVLYDCLKKTESDIAGCGFFIWRDENEWKRQREKSFSQKNEGKEPERIYSADEFLREGILNENSRCWSKLYKRSAIGGLRFRQGLSIGEDMLFLVDLLPAIKRAVEAPFQGYGYYQNPAGAMNRTFLPGYMDQIACWELAREKIVERDGRLETQVTTILMMAIMLTAGKLAMLSGKERRNQKQYIAICHEKIKRELQAPGAYAGLSGGYKIKVKLFGALPSVYLWLYHLRKLL